jgi:hypothetical protein
VAVVGGWAEERILFVVKSVAAVRCWNFYTRLFGQNLSSSTSFYKINLHMNGSIRWGNGVSQLYTLRRDDG